MRSCGDCRACCVLLAVPGHKPAKEQCPDQAPRGKPGCRRYATRPSACSDYTCEWLRSEALPAAWRPDRLGVIFDKLEPAPGTLEAQIDQAKVPWLTAREVYPKAFEAKCAARALQVASAQASLVLHFYQAPPALAPQGLL